MRDSENKITKCKTSLEMIKQAKEKSIFTLWDRHNDQSPSCGFGELGICCRICFMGPCRIDPFGEGASKGVCGATAETIAARNFLRMIAAGAASHSDHGRGVAQTFLATAQGKVPGYEIKDEAKLMAIAEEWGIKTEGKDKNQIAQEVGTIALAEFGRQEGMLRFLKRAPKARQEIWENLGVSPRGVDREIVECLHRTHMGVDQDYKSIMRQGSRAALADGWGGSMIATELQDILFKTPEPLRAKVNLGVLKKDEVNIIVHGHEPLLSEMIVMVAQDKGMLDLAKSKGAKGINISGICCTANEILMRHGIPIAGNFLQQELAIMTGAVEAMIVDVQCIMQSLPTVAGCFHTEIITTNERAHMEGAVHIQFEEHDPVTTAKEIIKRAIENYPKRGKVIIPKDSMDLVAGFSHETINYMLGGRFRSSYRPLNDAIIDGRIRGVAGVVGCNNPKVSYDTIHTILVRELIKNDVLVVQTGCSAIACAKDGLMIPEAIKYAGTGLREVCEAVGMPPVLHAGSCVDNSRILIAACNMVAEGGLGNDISELPVAGAAPEWMSEKAIAIGQYFVASGVFTVFGIGLPVEGSKLFKEHLFKELSEELGGSWAVEADPYKMAQLMIDHINQKREALGIKEKRERVLFDMAKRRELENV
ncbi:MAG: anaerobic carbon-monoxide dehydrogenase catalytic subunit [bacterium]